MVGVAHASDGGGSIRIPAACCGLFGLKAQRGRVSLMPDAEHWYGLSVFGCLSRTVLDSALFYDVVRGHVEGDAHTAPEPRSSFTEAARTAPGRLRIAFSTKPIQPGPVAGEVRKAVHDTAELLRSLGHEVVERDPSWGFQLPAFLPRYLPGSATTRANASSGAPGTADAPARRVRRAATRAAVRRPWQRSKSTLQRLGELFDAFDVLMTPTMARLPVEAGRWEGKGTARPSTESPDTSRSPRPGT